jgi:hypothetical protein
VGYHPKYSERWGVLLRALNTLLLLAIAACLYIVRSVTSGGRATYSCTEGLCGSTPLLECEQLKYGLHILKVTAWGTS